METVHEIIRKAELNYLQGTTKQGRYVQWSMHDTIERIDAYLNSKHISGEVDALGREKPFFNIAVSATNIWYRATDIDRKDIRFVPDNNGAVVLAFVANVLLQNWMDNNRFGQFLNLWGRSLARYGSSVTEFVEKDGNLVCSVIPWNRLVPDPVDFSALPVIKKLYLTPAQLRKNTNYDQAVVDELISAVIARRTLDKNQQDNKADFIEIYEVHGELPTELLKDEPDYSLKDKELKYQQQMHVVSYLESKKGEYDDFTLFKAKEAEPIHRKDDLIAEDGRTLGIGAVEYLFDAQWMVNHSAKNIKDTLDLASKLIFQTADANFANRNVLSAIESGDILVYDRTNGGPLERLANDKPDVSALMAFSQAWQGVAQEITNTPPIMQGAMPSRTSGRAQALVLNQANSLFELMTENKGLAIEDMIRTYVIPHLKKQLKNKDQVVAILDDAGVHEIDQLYIPNAAAKRFNKRVLDQLEQDVNNNTFSEVQPFDQQQEEMGVKNDLSKMGNKRFLVPDEVDDKTWEDLFSDFEWNNVRVEVTNESVDKQMVVQGLTQALQMIGSAANAGRPLTSAEQFIMGRLMTELGMLSPLQLSLSTVSSTPQPIQPQPQMPASAGPGGGALVNNLSLNGTTTGGIA